MSIWSRTGGGPARTRGVPYTDDDIATIRRIYAEHGGRHSAVAELAALLPTRSMKSLRERAYDLGCVLLTKDDPEIQLRERGNGRGHSAHEPVGQRVEGPNLVALSDLPKRCPDCGGLLAYNRMDHSAACMICGRDWHLAREGSGGH